MNGFYSLFILLGAAFWDYLIGDPVTWLHPVQVMGWLIGQFSAAVFVLSHYLKLTPRIQRVVERLAGICLSILLVGGSGLIGWGVAWGSAYLNPWFGAVTAIILLASCLAGRSLRAAATDVLTPWLAGDLSMARQRLSQYVGRDTQTLSPEDTLRAVLETVTENATDGVFAPLFYAILGLGLGVALPQLGSVPLGLAFALAYKAASTLDSCIGYKRAPYTYLGWFPARSEDGLTWLPCRLGVLSLALISGQPQRVWQICQRDGSQDPSPNSGWSMAAYAAILRVQLGGVNYYQGQPRVKPLLAEPLQVIQPEQVWQALRLTRRVCLLWLGLATVMTTAIRVGEAI